MIITTDPFCCLADFCQILRFSLDCIQHTGHWVKGIFGIKGTQHHTLSLLLTLAPLIVFMTINAVTDPVAVMAAEASHGILNLLPSPSRKPTTPKII
ncbi:MAG: hypothetical protein PHN46_06440 [Eubacteriales bacterium]|jgi:hypothetical protein|nr:hypothetical protein [Eubacteriales bacterium]